METAPITQDANTTPNDVSFGSYLSGRFAESQGDTENGIRFLRESLKRDPGNKEMLASLYRMLILSGKIEDAIVVARDLAGAKAVEEGNEFSPEMLLAIEEGKNKQYRAAEKHLSAIPKIGFNTLLVPLLDAWIKLGSGTLKLPVEAKSLAPEMHTILPQVHLIAGFLNDINKFDAEALKEYEAAIKDEHIEPFRAVEALNNYYARKNMPQLRQKLTDGYIAAHDSSFLAEELLNSRKKNSPAPLVSNVTEGLAEVFYTMANLFHGVRTPADEIAILRMAIYLRPNFPAAQFLLADAYELSQEYTQAINTYKTIDSQSPYALRGQIRAIYDQSAMGNTKTALVELDQILKSNLHDVDALLAKGDIERQQKHFKDAINTYTTAATQVEKLRKRDWIIFFSRGTCYERLHLWNKAESDMKKALELSPGEPDVLNYLGYSWLTMHRNIAEATKMIEDAYEARPEDAHIIDSMGYALYINADFSSAREYFEQALERTPNDPTVNDHLGDTYWQLGHKIEARYQWDRALANNPDEETEQDLRKKIAQGMPRLQPLSPQAEKKSFEPAPADE